MRLPRCIGHIRVRRLVSTACLSIFAIGRASIADAVILYQDDFNRANSINSLGSSSNGAWSIQRDPDNMLGPYDTYSPALGPDVEIFNNRLLFNPAGQAAGTVLNNNDMLSLYVNNNLDAVQQYTLSFSYIHHAAHQYDATLPGSQISAGFFLLPRAQGDDLVSNQGYVIRTTVIGPTPPDTPGAPLALYFYDGHARSGSPANIPTASLVATQLADPVGMVADTSYLIEVAVNANLATLKVNGTVVDENRDLGSIYNNATADHVMLGSNALGTGQRRTVVSIDDLVVNQGAAAFAAADFNESGSVTGADLNNWKGDFGKATGATHQQGDSDADGDVDGADFLTWQNQLAVPVAVGVPEPASLGLALVGALCAATWRRRLHKAPH
jgi:hypothetical protein